MMRFARYRIKLIERNKLPRAILPLENDVAQPPVAHSHPFEVDKREAVAA